MRRTTFGARKPQVASKSGDHCKLWLPLAALLYFSLGSQRDVDFISLRLSPLDQHHSTHTLAP